MTHLASLVFPIVGILRVCLLQDVGGWANM